MRSLFDLCLSLARSDLEFHSDGLCKLDVKGDSQGTFLHMFEDVSSLGWGARLFFCFLSS